MAFVDEEMKQIENGCAGMTDGIVWKDVGGSASLVVVVVDSIQRGHVTRDEAWFNATFDPWGFLRLPKPLRCADA